MQETIKNIIRKELVSKSLIYPFVSDLTEREKYILASRSPNLPKVKSFKVLSEEFGLSRERIRQIEANARNKIKFQSEIIDRLAEKLFEALFSEKEIEAVFMEGCDKGNKYPKTMLIWKDFTKKLWKNKDDFMNKKTS